MRMENRDSRPLSTGHYAGLKFKQGWWFIQVLETETIELKPWTLLNENGNRAEIAAQTAGSQDDEIVDTVNRKFLEPDDDEQNLVFQVMFGVAPSRMQVYPIFGRDRMPNLEGTAEPGTPQVFVNGFDSPYNNPSEHSEIFTVDDMETLSLQAFNPMDEATEAKLSFIVNKIKYATVTDMGLMKAMIQGQQPFRGHQVGLGAQERDQLRAPSWLTRAFGDDIHETEEILAHEGGPQTSATPTMPGQTDAVTQNQ